jgi:formate dehydrogenase major subunit
MGDDERDFADENATVCPFCAVGCTLTPGEGGRAGGVPGPVNRAGRLCRTGIETFETLSADDRLRTPYVRRDDDLVPASWEEALSRAEEDLRAVRDTHGSDALAFLGAPHCTNEENFLLSKLARTLGTNNVDNRARLCHASAMTALEDRLGYPAMTNSLDDLERADVLLVVGANPATQQPIAFDSYIRPAVNAGTTLVHLDPRANRTTRLADVHLPTRPGADAVALEALCALIDRAGWTDEAFVDARTTGYDAYADSLAAVDAETAAPLAGVDVDELSRVARLLGEADRVAAIAATGIEEDDHESTTTADALLNLLLLTGNVGRPGTGMNVFRGLNNEQGASDAGCRPDRLPGYQPVSNDAARERLAAEWSTQVPSTPGLDAREALAAFGDGVRGALAVGENPAVEKRADEWVGERLDGLETLVVVDAFASETTAYADIVLPAASGVEKSGTVTNLDRRVQRLRPVVEPPGEARSDFAILRALGRRLVGDAFDYADPAEAFAELTRVSPIHAGLDLDAVADGGVQWPARNGSETKVLYADSFETSDGRAPLVEVDADVPNVPDVAPNELVLVVGSRAGGFDAAERVDRRLGLHETDAERAGLADGDRALVSNEATDVTTTVSTDGTVREGTAYLHADVADPLVRNGARTVRVRPASAPTGERGRIDR